MGSPVRGQRTGFQKVAQVLADSLLRDIAPPGLGRTRNTPLQQRAHFRTWLERGRAGDANLGAGHIRWSKLTKGLSGKLGEFTARIGQTVPGQGHSIVIELANGAIATGFAAADGRLLDPEILVSNDVIPVSSSTWD